MQLSIPDVAQFFRLHRALMFFVNQRLKVLDREVATTEAYASLPAEARIKVHQAMIEHIDLIDAFARDNPIGCNEAELEIVRSWKHLVTGTFYAYHQLQSHMVFLTSTEPVIAYGVVALFDPFEHLIGPHLPKMLKTTFLPFKGRIVYDGLITGYNVSFGAGIKRGLAESYQEAKAQSRIITSLLPLADGPPPARIKADTGTRTTGRKTSRVGRKAAAALAHDRIVALIDAFCRDYLDEEYQALCHNLAGVLARKRPSPLIRGKPESWAGAIVRVIGGVNFLSDPSQPHHMKMTDIDKAFGISEATGSAKATLIRKLLDVSTFDPQWTIPSLMIQNPMAWMIQVNGLIVDARRIPREAQAEAFRRGLIPFIPADRADGPSRKP